MGRELFQALKIAAQNNHARCLIITGNGRAFSAGEDIQDLRGQYERGETPDYDNVFSTNTTRLFGEFVKLQNQSSPR